MDERPIGPPEASDAPRELRVGKYRILGEVGRGGMGVVYRALDEGLGREVALKSPLPADASEAHRRRFLREARTASRVSHQHIVPIYEVFEDGDRPWLAMELVQGRSLRAVLKAEGLPLEEALLLGEQIAEALDAMHESSVLHRDLTPNNIMLTPRGGARLMDFGLARFLDSDQPGGEPSDQTFTSVGQGIRGTLGYISPEQILGRPLTPPSDLFSLGAVLYEMASGRRAFGGGSPGEIFDATLYLEPPALSESATDTPKELDRIIRRALAKRPEDRYQSARELSTDLRALRRQLESQHYAAVVKPDTRPFGWRAVVVVLVGLAGAAAIWATYARRPEGPVPLGTPRQLTVAPGWEAEPALGPDGSLVAYASDQSGNSDIWLMDVQTGASLRLTDDAAADRSPTWLPDGSAILFVSDRGGKTAIWKTPRLGGPAALVLENAEDPAVSPDGLQLAFARRDASGNHRIGVALLGDLANTQLLTTADDGLFEHHQPRWSPDSRRIVYRALRDLWVISMSDSREANVSRLTMEDAADRDPVWSPNGRSVYFSSVREGTFALWRVPAEGGTPTLLVSGQGPIQHPSVSRDGSRLIYSTFAQNPNLIVRDLESGRDQNFGGERREVGPVFSPDGLSMAFISDRWAGRFDVWLQPFGLESAVGDARRLTDQPGSVSAPAFSPDGQWLAYYRVTEGQRDVWVVPTRGGAPMQFTTDPAADLHPDWSPDGRQLVFLSGRDGTEQIWTQPVADGRPAGEPRRLTTGPSVQGAPAWSGDGSTIAFLGSDSEIWLTSPDGRTPLRQLTRGAGALRVAWNRAAGTLWATGYWGADVPSIRVVDLKNGAARSPIPPIVLSRTTYPDFDIAWDGRRIVFSREELHGDLWVQEARARTF